MAFKQVDLDNMTIEQLSNILSKEQIFSLLLQSRSSPMNIIPTINAYDSYYEDNSQSLLQKMELTGRVPSREKYRRMICQTYVCCGGCPYNERCVFLHDERIELKGFKTRPNKLSKSPTPSKDSFFWPDMKKETIYQKLDYLGLPTSNQPYDIPKEFSYPERDIHDKAMYSMWYHFVSFCISQRNSSESPTSDIIEMTYTDSPFQKNKALSRSNLSTNSITEVNDDSSSPYNKFLYGTKRLPVFIKLSSTLSMQKGQMIRIEDDRYNGSYCSEVTPRFNQYDYNYSPIAINSTYAGLYYENYDAYGF